ncbi:hypothetical protein FO519_010548 [Halicephalobus sp. NKZ332]|nr:hypothetical protein FO519_010548 [Halicephalobus sp. NKZ332]
MDLNAKMVLLNINNESHPPPAQRQFSVQPKSTKITLRNLVLQNFDNGRYTNRHTLDLYLEFNELTTAADFTMGLLAHHYREQ